MTRKQHNLISAVQSPGSYLAIHPIPGVTNTAEEALTGGCSMMPKLPVMKSPLRFQPQALLFTTVGSNSLYSRLADQTTVSSILPTTTSNRHPGTEPMIPIIADHSLQSWRLARRASTTTDAPTTSLNTATPFATSDTDIGTPTPDSLQSEINDLNYGSKIGVIIGGVVLIILSGIAFWFCVLNGSRRIKKWTAKNETKRVSELNLWETELRNGRTKKRTSHVGLWDGLRMERNIQEADAESRLENVNMRERAGETSSRARAGNRNEESDTQEARIVTAPSCMPGDRFSVVSSARHLTPLTVILPVHTRNTVER
jgi:hypothetical protein